jgi:hypothetical protein
MVLGQGTPQVDSMATAVICSDARRGTSAFPCHRAHRTIPTARIRASRNNG